MNWDAIVLAAGDGTRMLSKLPKVMQKVAGQPMIVRAIEALNKSGASHIHVVISKKIESDMLVLKDQYSNLSFHIQAEPLGTADAVYAVKAKLSPYVLICNGDHPLVNAEDIQSFVNQSEKHGSELSLALLDLKEPGSFGRVVMKSENLAAEIVEAKHCSNEQLKISTVNSGIYFSRSDLLFQFLDSILGAKASSLNVNDQEKLNSKTSTQKSPANNLTKADSTQSKKEFYLTDIVKYLNDKDLKVTGFVTTDALGFGVNDALALNEANQLAFAKINSDLMKKGVKFINASATYIEASVEVEPDVVIYPNVFIFGKSKIESGTVIESGSHIKNSQIGPNSMIKAGSYLEGAKVLGHSSIGPYAHLREGSVIHGNVKVGNFAEIKNSTLFEGVKAGHQCYLGDAEIGENTNIGAGTITCNFAADGKKYKTKIGKNVFVGSDTQIVPPLTIEDNSVIAAGATVTKNVEAKSLYVTRAKAIVKPNYRK